MPATTTRLLRIGALSRLARVSIKTLRFYDDAGVFPPAWIDPRTGYRYYSATQLPILHRIRLLRELGCSVAEVRLLTTSGAGNGLGPNHAAGLRRRLMIQVARAEQRLRQLDTLYPQPDPAGSEKLCLMDREISPTPAFTVRDSVPSGGDNIHRMFESAEREIARRDVRAQRSPFLLLYDLDYRQPHLDVEVCVPTTDESLGLAGVRLIEPVSRAACVQFSGSYDQVPILLDAALDTLQGTRARIDGPVREVYLRFGADQRGYTLDTRFLASHQGQYCTELQIPLRPWSAAG